jgi:catechol 2,3-dioxygenase-like lactoylglutathione lyase family enzyme
MGVPGCKFKGIFMKRDGMRIEIIGFTAPPPDPARRRRQANEIGHSHLSFYVASLDEALAYLRSKGVEVDEESRTRLSMGIECCVVRDPDGFPIEIVEQPAALLPYETDS